MRELARTDVIAGKVGVKEKAREIDKEHDGTDLLGLCGECQGWSC